MQYDHEAYRAYRRTNTLMGIGACLGVALVLFASLWFATSGPHPVQCASVGAIAVERIDGTTTTSQAPIYLHCEDQP
jgi:hypothetical protein